MTAWLCPLCNEVDHAAGTHCTGCGLEREPKQDKSPKARKPGGPLWDRHLFWAGKYGCLIFV